MELKRIKDVFKTRIEDIENLSDLPLSLAKIIRTELKDLNFEERKECIALIKLWIKYVDKNNLNNISDPFVMRFHLSEFAKSQFGKPKERMTFESASIEELRFDRISFKEIMSQFTDVDIFDNPEISIYGGVARLALKIFAEVDVSSELPINDIDIITNSKNPYEISQKYKVDLAGTKVVDGDLLEATEELAYSVDCSMNQVAILNGKLLYTKQALEDVKNGDIRLLGKEDPLFGVEGFKLPGGHVYLTRSGFYRTLSFLLRGKGNRILVSKENLEREKNNIGRYWLVILFVKLLKIQDKNKLDKSIINWYIIARQIGSTDTDSPFEFLDELLQQFPEMQDYGKEGDFDINSQIRWLIGKLVSRGVDSLLSSEENFTLPETCTPADITLPHNTPELDLNKFWDRINTIKKI